MPRSPFTVPLCLLSSVALVGGASVIAATTSSASVAPSAVPATAIAQSAAKTPKSCSVGAGVSAKQVVVVRSTGSRATVKACRRVSAGKYVVSLGPYSGHVGRNGVAKKGAKREGDGKTPYGTYKLRGGFGTHAKPGVTFSWFKTDSRDRWVDDSHSKYYNLHKRTPVNGRWASAEKLKVTPAYEYAQVIGYNEKRTPGRGSAIFFHVDTGHGTAGCVSLKRSSLLKIMRWEKPGAVMSIKKAAVPTKTAVASRALVGTSATLPKYTSSSRKATKADVRYSWHKGCPVAISSLRVVRVRYLGWDKKAHLGSLVVNKSVATDVRSVFGKLYKARFQIHRMVTVDHYKGSDTKSMAADNTSAFNCRNVQGTSHWSNHAYGLAVDINTVENPYVTGAKVQPTAGRAYLNRSMKKKGLIHANGKVVKAFRSKGFLWGGRWADPDYQHFDL